ncbi:MAG: hypothetical protein IKS19_00910 [Clostridia bacterium]|nr:hypothetical protein [Clostridia bacterium]
MAAIISNNFKVKAKNPTVFGQKTTPDDYLPFFSQNKVKPLAINPGLCYNTKAFGFPLLRAVGVNAI